MTIRNWMMGLMLLAILGSLGCCRWRERWCDNRCEPRCNYGPDSRDSHDYGPKDNRDNCR